MIMTHAGIQITHLLLADVDPDAAEALLPPVYQLGLLHLLGCVHRGVQARVHGVAGLQLHLQQANKGVSGSDVRDYNTCSTLNTGPYWRGFPSSGQKAGYLNICQ